MVSSKSLETMLVNAQQTPEFDHSLSEACAMLLRSPRTTAFPSLFTIRLGRYAHSPLWWECSSSFMSRLRPTICYDYA